MASYTLKLERDEDGYWVGTIEELQGAHTQGRSVKTVRERIREAIAAATGDVKGARTAEILEDFAVPKFKHVILSMTKARDEALQASRKVVEKQQEVAYELVCNGNYSVRDAGAIIGLTGSRVQQLVNQKKEVLGGKKTSRREIAIVAEKVKARGSVRPESSARRVSRRTRSERHCTD